MNPVDRVRRLCLALPGAWEKLSHGEPTFWVGKSMFATFADAANHHGAGRHAVWCKSTHETQDVLRELDPARFFSPPYVGKSGWIGIYLDRGPNWLHVAERLAEAHTLATQRKARPKNKTRRAVSGSDPAASSFERLIELIVSGNGRAALTLLEDLPRLAKGRAVLGATRQAPGEHYFDSIAHYMYAGDTALHIAAAAHQSAVVAKLISIGADVSARNRHGAGPLHYAADGGPHSPLWNPKEQSETISMLLCAGADPNAIDKRGVTPLHRAVRNCSAAAVAALLMGGANPNASNGTGSPPLRRAMRNTGKSGSGSEIARKQRREIERLLLESGAK